VACGDTYKPFNAAASAAYVPMYSNPSNIGLYVQYEGGNYMELNAPQLVNIPVVIVTSREAAAKQNYELFAELGTNHSEAVYLTDLHAVGGPLTMEITDALDYSFSLAGEAAYVEGENSVIADRFVLNYAPYWVKTNAYGYATYSNTLDLTMPAGLKAYTGAINGEFLDLAEMDYIAANEGVIVKGEASTTYVLTPGTGSSVYGTNHLKPTSGFDPANYSNVFVLQGEALYEYTGNTALKANKAYLQLPSSTPGAAPKRISFRFNNTTAVENVAPEAMKAEKFMENGQMFIKRGDVVYTIQGQVVK
jgi:hypothetical protein